jgi:hypothetical protein
MLGPYAPHDFRRYIATYLLSEGMRREVVPQFLGHTSPETTRKAYAMTWDEVMDDQVATYRPALSEAAERAHGKVKKLRSGRKRRAVCTQHIEWVCGLCRVADWLSTSAPHPIVTPMPWVSG